MRLVEATDHRSCVPFIPLWDIHWEDNLCDRVRFLKTVDEIEKRDAWTGFGGDAFAMNWDHSVRSMSETRGERLAVEVASLCSVLERIKKRILFGIDGNHEDAGIREGNLSLMEVICNNLSVPYCGESAAVSFHIGTNAGRKARHNVTLYCTHGVGGGQTEGATLNVVAKLKKEFVVADAYICVHTHTPANKPEEPWELVRGSKGPEGEYLRQREVWLINAGSFQMNRKAEPLTEREKGNGWHPLLVGGYGAKKAFTPQTTGAPLILLHSTEKGYSITVPTPHVV